MSKPSATDDGLARGEENIKRAHDAKYGKYKTPPPTAQGMTDPEPRDWKPVERHMLFVRGFGDGACFKAMAHDDHCDYVAGYEEGRTARGIAIADFDAAVGYVPTVLRLAESQ